MFPTPAAALIFLFFFGEKDGNESSENKEGTYYLITGKDLNLYVWCFSSWGVYVMTGT